MKWDSPTALVLYFLILVWIIPWWRGYFRRMRGLKKQGRMDGYRVMRNTWLGLIGGIIVGVLLFLLTGLSFDLVAALLAGGDDDPNFLQGTGLLIVGIFGVFFWIFILMWADSYAKEDHTEVSQEVHDKFYVSRPPSADEEKGYVGWNDWAEKYHKKPGQPGSFRWVKQRQHWWHQPKGLLILALIWGLIFGAPLVIEMMT